MSFTRALDSIILRFTSSSPQWYEAEHPNKKPTGLSEGPLGSSLKFLSEDILSDVIRFLEVPRVCVKCPTGWYLILFIINFSTSNHRIRRCSDILLDNNYTEHWSIHMINSSHFQACSSTCIVMTNPGKMWSFCLYKEHCIRYLAWKELL